MEISNLIPHIEALVFASDRPLTTLELTDLLNNAFGFMEDKITLDQVEAAMEGIVEKYDAEFYPFGLRQSGGGWQVLTKKDFHKTVAQLNGEKFLKRLSAAALETLAIVAYKQPVTKGEIEAIRGVSSDYAVQKLLEKELIVITGRNEKMPGHPLVYATSKNFMDYFGINSPEDLQKIREVLADQLVEPTVVNHTDFEPGELAVSDNGQLILDGDTPTSEEEGFVNGHTFGVSENDEQEAGTIEPAIEDESTEEAVEEFIADETFIEGDEVEETEEIKEASQDDLSGEEDAGEEPGDDQQPGNEDQEENK